MTGTVGIIANPASGKDIRRLVAAASVFDNAEKLSIVRRAIAGAAAAGVSHFVYMPDSHGIAGKALDEADADIEFEAVPVTGTNSALETTRAATQMRERGVGCLITLGGDGTNRAVALGWQDAPLVAISTGTNNVFPRMIEASIAGTAAGLVASGRVPGADACHQVKVVYVRIEGEKDDLALIDAVLLDEKFIGSRAVWDPTRLRTIVLARADPAATGISSIGGLIHPVRDADDAGLLLEIGPSRDWVTAPIVPGLYRDVPVRSIRTLGLGESVVVEGPGVLALDGERERRLALSRTAKLTVRRDGPMVVDVSLVMKLAACRGLFRGKSDEVEHGD